MLSRTFYTAYYETIPKGNIMSDFWTVTVIIGVMFIIHQIILKMFHAHMDKKGQQIDESTMSH